MDAFAQAPDVFAQALDVFAQALDVFAHALDVFARVLDVFARILGFPATFFYFINYQIFIIHQLKNTVMNNSDYLPKNDRQLHRWVVVFLNYLFAALSRLGFPNDVYNTLAGMRDDFGGKIDIAEDTNTRTKVTVQEKNTVKAALKAAIRQAVKEYLMYNPAVTDADRDGLGLPIHKTTRTPVPPPTQLVDFFLAKPYGVRGAEFGWAVLPEPPKSYDDLVHSAFDTRSPYTFQFDLPDAGKTLYVCARRENTTGQKGPWSEIKSVIIP